MSRLVRVIPLALAAALTACAGPSTLAPEQDSVAYREDPHLQRVWLIDGVSFQTYDAVLIGETRSQTVNVNTDGLENLAWARGVVRNEVAAALKARNAVPAVVLNEADLRPGARVLRLENTIVEYEKGGGGARFFAGI
jgi:hypothetical protein